MNHLEYIKSKAIEANPEIIKLQKGCKIEVKDFGVCEFSDHWINAKAPIHYEDSGYLVIKHGMGWDGRYADFHTVYEYLNGKKQDNKDVKILGRDINLGDIVWTLLARYSTPSMVFQVLMDKYDGRKPLHLQSPETLKWLAELLGYKELLHTNSAGQKHPSDCDCYHCF